MSIFARQKPPKQWKDYRKYLPYLREDFCRECAYCAVREEENGGEENFEIDHFKPSSKFPDLRAAYVNLYYSCRTCNRSKGNTWPEDVLVNQGYCFIDSCLEDPYSADFRELTDGRLEAISRKGEYSIPHIRLNRQRLVTLRLRRRQMALLGPRVKAVIDRAKSMEGLSAFEGDEILGAITSLVALLQDGLAG